MSAATEFVVDTADDVLAEAVARVLGARTRRHRTTSGADATAELGGARVVVVAPTGPDLPAIVQPVRWWLRAAATTGARVVLVSTSRVFGAAATGPAPDEWALPAPDDEVGRAWRAAESLVAQGAGAVVRAGPGHAADDVAGLLAWVAVGRHVGVWHLDGHGLDGALTAVARADEPLELRAKAWEPDRQEAPRDA